MLSSSRWLPSLRRAWKPLDLTSSKFPRIAASQLIDEETLPGYVASRYYPVRIGEILQERYQVVGKFGFGTSSTVWLARDLSHRRHVALKLFINSEAMGSQFDDEINMYRRLEKVPKKHAGADCVRSLFDHFDVHGPSGKHRCLVHQPLFESVFTFLHRNPVAKLPVPIVAVVLKFLFLGLDFLHRGCGIIHTDIKADNIMFSIDDEGVFTDFAEREMKDPSPRKEVDGRFIYQTRELRMPNRMGHPVLCDLGSAVASDVEHTEDVQPDVYRSPEVMLEVPWSHEIDIWNAGCMIWDIFEGGHLFTGHDPEHDVYRSRAHLSEVVALLGNPPQDLLARGSLSDKFFTKDGSFRGGISVPDSVSLEKIETTLEGEDKVLFLKMLRKMLKWDPRERASAAELVEDEWIQRHT